MYLRLRKRKKPLPTDNTSVVVDAGVEPTTGPGELAASSPSSDWVPPEPNGDADPGVEIGTSRHPNRGKARESARGSHR